MKWANFGKTLLPTYPAARIMEKGNQQLRDLPMIPTVPRNAPQMNTPYWMKTSRYNQYQPRYFAPWEEMDYL